VTTDRIIAGAGYVRRCVWARDQGKCARCQAVCSHLDVIVITLVEEHLRQRKTVN
jgi:hypothetical protein